jgi:methylmalonyl-CoA mutase N-terminal domain/subunit
MNKFQNSETGNIKGFKIDDHIGKTQVEKLALLRKRRDHAKCDQILQTLNDKASGSDNIMPTVIEAVENHCTLGEVADTLREVFGEYK